MTIFGTLDRYVARAFVSSYVLCAGIGFILFVTVDALFNLGDLLERDSGVLLGLLEFYAARTPLLFQRFGSFLTLAAGMLDVARLERNNELIPIVSSGTSVFRALAPVLMGAALAFFNETATTEMVIPTLAEEIRAQGLLGSSDDRPGIMRDRAGNTLFAGSYDASERRLRWVTLRERDADGEVVRAYHGDEARWVRDPASPTGGWWWLPAGYTVSQGVTEPIPAREGVLLPTSVEPVDVESMNERVSLLGFGALRRQYLRQPYLPSLRVQLHERMARPLGHVILLMLGLPFVLGRGRRGAGVFLGLIAVVVICAAYFLSGFFFYALGADGALHPFWAAWTPAIVFGLAAIWLFGRVQT
jgi:lipopolysaccharide export LptBFGC system permease protein LptF